MTSFSFNDCLYCGAGFVAEKITYSDNSQVTILNYQNKGPMRWPNNHSGNMINWERSKRHNKYICMVKW